MNANAGALKSTPGIEEVQQLIDHMGVDARVIGTRSKADMLAQLHGFVSAKEPRVAVAGGDGTVTEAIQVVAKSDTALAIVAQGTANNVANALRLPMDLPSALRVIQEGEVRPIDLGRAFDRYFIESAGVGLFANALAIYGSANKNVLRGLFAMMKIFLSLRASRVVLTLDGERVEEPSVFCAAANTYRMGAMMPIAPGAKVTDGLLDLVVLGDLSRSELLPYYRAIRKQLHMLMPKASFFRAREIKLESRHRMPVHVDDRVRGATPVTISCEPAALKAVVERL